MYEQIRHVQKEKKNFFYPRQLVLLSKGYALLLDGMSIIITATQFMSNCLMILNTVKHENVIQKEVNKK